MKVKAIGKLDFEATKALVHLCIYRKNEPKKRMIFWTIVYMFLISVILFELFLFGMDTDSIALLLCAIFILGLQYYLYFFLPKIHYNSLAGMKDMTNIYTFTDETIHIISNETEYSGQCEIKYSLIVNAFETKKYLFLYQNKSQVFIVDKSTINDGAIDDIKSKLISSISGKYIICNY